MNYYLLCFILSALMTVIHLYKWKNQYGLHFSLMYIFATVANMGYWQIYDATQVNQAILANKIAYVGGCFATLSLLMCIFSVCKVEISNKVRVLLYIFPCAMYASSLTVGYNDMFYKNVSLEYVDGRYNMVKEYAFCHTLFYIFLVSYVMISLVVLIIGFKKKKEVSFKSVRLMFLVMLINFLSFFVGRALFDVELIAASYVVTEAIVLVITNRLVLYNIDEMVVLSMMNKGEMGAVSFAFDYSFLGCNDVARNYYPQFELLAVDKKVDSENEELKELVSWLDELHRQEKMETVYQREDRFYKVSGKYLYDKNRKRGYQLILTDFTEEKQRGEELIRVATKAKSDVLAQMSHEIRTPINAICGMNEMILRTTGEGSSKQYAKDVKRAAESLLEIVNEILDFSKIDSGKMELVCMEYSLADLLTDITNMFRIRAEDKGLQFVLTVDKSLLDTLYGDDVKIRQILSNLLSNAVKYTLTGKVELKVEGTVCEEGVKLHFGVKDTGIGIKEEDRSKLFTEFERIEEKQNRGIEGTGLGMSITIHLLQMMESSLMVDSVYGEGSEFYFDLKQQMVSEETIGDAFKKQKEYLQEHSYQQVFVAPEAKVLVVDDNKMNLRVFCDLLTETKVQIDAAESGEECLDLVRQKKYNIIFLDHMMPGMDGIETLHRLKTLSDSKCPDAPVVALTANAISGAKEFYLSEGFDDFLPKPFHPETLERMILAELPEEYIVYETEDDKSDVTEDDKQELETYEKLWNVYGMDIEYAMSHFKNQTSMLSSVEEFAHSMSHETDKLKQFYEELQETEESFKQYRVQVHSMKSAANLVGIKELGEKAQQLENAAKICDRRFLSDETEGFLEKWSAYESVLVPIFQKVIEKQMFDTDAVKEQLEELKNAFEDMDIDRMDAIVRNINEYAFSDEIISDIKILTRYVADLDDEQGIPQIEKVIKMIS